MSSPAKQSFSPRRPLGGTGFLATQLGIGDVADRNQTIETCVATVRRAVEAGLNVIDTAPNYEDGYSEEIVGRALQGWTDPVFLIDKIDHFDRKVAPQIEESLRRLQREYVDAFVFHSVSSPDAFESLCITGGGFDQLAAAKAAGQCRFRGISSHHPDVLRKALTMGLCDIVMFPVGPFVDERYITEILPLAKSLGVGTVCFKTFGAGKLLGDTSGYNQPLRDRPRGKVSSGGNDNLEAVLPRLTVEDCLHYTLTIDPDVALLGMSFPNEQDAAFAAAKSFRPFDEARLDEIRQQAIDARQDKGPCWWNPDPTA